MMMFFNLKKNVSLFDYKILTIIETGINCHFYNPLYNFRNSLQNCNHKFPHLCLCFCFSIGSIVFGFCPPLIKIRSFRFFGLSSFPISLTCNPPERSILIVWCLEDNFYTCFLYLEYLEEVISKPKHHEIIDKNFLCI